LPELAMAEVYCQGAYLPWVAAHGMWRPAWKCVSTALELGTKIRSGWMLGHIRARKTADFAEGDLVAWVSGNGRKLVFDAPERAGW